MSTEQLEVINYPSPCLRRKAKPIEKINDDIHAVAARMIELMHQAEGVGLAAPQVNLSWRMFVTHSRREGDVNRVYINPVLKNPAGEWETREEGCLSLPEIAGDVRRPSQITIEALDLEGNTFTMTSDDFLARIWQHEFDHLNGILIIDRFTQKAKLATRRAVKTLEKNASK